MRLVRGRSTPAIRAINQSWSFVLGAWSGLGPWSLVRPSSLVPPWSLVPPLILQDQGPGTRNQGPSYPCRCLCFWFEQITRTTPRRRTILHLSQIRLTDARTFIVVPVHVERETRKARKEEFYFAASAVFAFHVFVTPSRRCARAGRP